MCTKVYKGGFMSLGWADNLDMLAQNGVLVFDAPAYITGQKPRYVGGLSSQPSPFVGPMPNNQNLQQPKVDEFSYENKDKKDIVSNPAWKKWGFGLVAAGALIFGGYKFKSKLIPWVKNAYKKISFKSVKDFVVDKSKKVGKFFKDGWDKFVGLFKSKKP